jgi:GTPase SAR1 family protein
MMAERPVLVTLLGLPGAGKSTLARTLVKDLPRRGMATRYESIDRILRIQNPPGGEGDGAEYRYEGSIFLLQTEARIPALRRAARGLAAGTTLGTRLDPTVCRSVALINELATTEATPYFDALERSRAAMHDHGVLTVIVHASSAVRWQRNVARAEDLRLPRTVFDYFEDHAPDEASTRRSCERVSDATILHVDGERSPAEVASHVLRAISFESQGTSTRS